ncbi:MAG: hypothetical protein V1934_04010 [Methanobacteriota archaeon]
MRGTTAAAWGLLSALAAWDIASALGGPISDSIALCALAFVAAAPALVRWEVRNALTLRLRNFLGRVAPYASAGLLGASHFVLKDPSGSSLMFSVIYIVALLAFAELARWARYSSGFGENVASGVDSAWSRTFGSRFVPLLALSVGLAMAAVVLAVGLDGTWTALALAVGLIVTMALTARTAARVA